MIVEHFQQHTSAKKYRRISLASSLNSKLFVIIPNKVDTEAPKERDSKQSGAPKSHRKLKTPEIIQRDGGKHQH